MAAPAKGDTGRWFKCVLPAILRELRLTDSGFRPAAPLVSLAAAAGAGGIAAWGVRGDTLRPGSRSIRFAIKSELPLSINSSRGTNDRNSDKDEVGGSSPPRPTN